MIILKDLKVFNSSLLLLVKILDSIYYKNNKDNLNNCK